MRRSLVVLLMGVTSIGYGQKTMNVVGQVKDLKGKLYIDTYIDGTVKRDSILVSKNGNIKGSLKVGTLPEKRRFWFGGSGLLTWVEPGTMHISGSVTDSTADIKMVGTPTQNDYTAYLDGHKQIGDSINKAYFNFPADEDSIKKKENVDKYFSLMSNALENYDVQFVKTHPNSFQSLDIIEDRQNDYELCESLLQTLYPRIKNSAKAKEIQQQMVIGKRSANGAPILDFTRNDPDGNPVFIASYKGKYVLIDFWASWCHPCRAENPNVVAAYNKFKDKGFDVLSVSIDDDANSWKKAIAADGLPWKQVLDRKDRKSPILDYYGIRGIPSQILIDPNGIIVGRNLRGDKLEKALAQILH